MQISESQGPVPIDQARLGQLARELWRSGQRVAPRRFVVGIAGIPGSGKSTLAADLFERLDRLEPGVARVVPMDGFHLPNTCLRRRGLIGRKGAAETFDAAAYVDLIRRARASGGSEVSLRFPIYDRVSHEPVLTEDVGQTIGPAVRVVLTEGNYLLLDQPPWSELAGLLDACWWLETPVGVAALWLIERHVRGGREPADARRHYERSCRVNTDLVLRRRRCADRCLRWPFVSGDALDG